VPGRILLDTNVAIYLATGHTIASRYLPHIEPERALLYWRSTVPVYIVLFPDLDTCEIWARITAACHRRGRPRQDNDLWIAATALRYQLPLLTHNRRDFADIPGLTVISEAPGAP